MEAELRKKDRVEEWRSRWEQREQEPSEELKAREDAFIFQQLKRDSELFKIMKEMEEAVEKNMLQKADALGYLYKEHQKEIKAVTPLNPGSPLTTRQPVENLYISYHETHT